ncbi:DUF1493 family protein [Bacteroides sp. 519]|uniref:DUF1493 family protein n=1 Tax=Bacteroides sp. 519 TaxID=2302937 RepID=UPI0013D5D4C3|nr:DUF1493 family protein [Bacteroides sp. 519]NDV57674.1 DUF1493 family protein [Bacteroides sp. 519]
MNRELIDFIIKSTTLKEEVLNENAKLEKDLYFYGEDADFFMYNYSESFHVDISNLDFSLYFTPEIYFYFYPLYRRFSKRYKQKKDLTIGDLEKGIKYGRLDDEIIFMKD